MHTLVMVLESKTLRAYPQMRSLAEIVNTEVAFAIIAIWNNVLV